MASSSSSFIKKEPVVASNEVLPNPFVSAETLKSVRADWSAPFGSRRRSGVQW